MDRLRRSGLALWLTILLHVALVTAARATLLFQYSTCFWMGVSWLRSSLSCLLIQGLCLVAVTQIQRVAASASPDSTPVLRSL